MLILEYDTAHLLPFKSQAPGCPDLNSCRKTDLSASPASLHPDRSTHSQVGLWSARHPHVQKRRAAAGGKGLSPGFVLGGNGHPWECWCIAGEDVSRCSPPPGKSYPSHSQPASCCAAYSKEGMGAWPHVDGGWMVTSIWDETFFHGGLGENGQLHPLHAFGKHIWVKVTDLWVGGKGQGVPRGGWESVTV